MAKKAAKAETRVFSIRLPVTVIDELHRLAEESRRTLATQTLIIIENGMKTPCPARRKS